MAIILIVVIIFVVYILINASKESEVRKKTQKELSDKYIKFISEFNKVNGTHYSLSDDLNATFNKCLVDYIFTDNYVLPFVSDRKYDISLHNYRYRDMNNYKESNIYKLEECKLIKLIDSQKAQNIKLFYNTLFSIPIHTFSIEYKINAAYYIKGNNPINIDIFTEYRDTGELCLNSFTIIGQHIESKGKHLGSVSDYE